MPNILSASGTLFCITISCFRRLLYRFLSCREQLLKAESPTAVFSCLQLIEHDFKEASEHPARFVLKGPLDDYVISFIRTRSFDGFYIICIGCCFRSNQFFMITFIRMDLRNGVSCEM